MAHYKYLIVGGGMTADAAVRGIRQIDAQGTIGLVTTEKHPPYDRPPLSKGLWKTKLLAHIWRKTETLGVDLHLGHTVHALDLSNKEAIDEGGMHLAFDKLLLATGGTPRQFSFGAAPVIYFRTLDDYQRLRALSAQHQRLAVIGGGFIGSEIAAALAMNGKEVVMIFPEGMLGERLFPPALARFVSDYYRQKGVELWAGDSVIGVEMAGDQWTLRTQLGREVRVGGVVAGLGITPNVELARSAGLELNNGILVDELLRTTHPDVYSAGDVANFYNPALGKRLRVEHEDNANMMGLAAGRLMAGQREPYVHLPYFFSDLFELGYEALGELDARLEMVEDWTEPNKKGVIYYLHGGRVRGVLLWNVWQQLEAARRLIADPGPFTPDALVGRLPEGK
jgi:3-phenylpropionate/trans-cinnamate dioxygenase ferredoxin reductase component